MIEPIARWAGRNFDKDGLRRSIWKALEATGIGIGPVWSRIPNFVDQVRFATSAVKKLGKQAELLDRVVLAV